VSKSATSVQSYRLSFLHCRNLLVVVIITHFLRCCFLPF
jgi:hypothetical protein